MFQHQRVLFRSLLWLFLPLGLTVCGGDDSTGGGTGSLRLVTTTTGDDLDPDGYAISVDGSLPFSIASNAEQRLDNLASGSHGIQVDGVAANCAVLGSATVPARVTSGDTVTVSIGVSCVEILTGVLGVAVTTSGSPIDPDGYRLRIDGTQTVMTEVNDTSYFTLLRGDHNIKLDSLWVYCDIANTSEGLYDGTASVLAKDTVIVQVGVTCQNALHNKIVFAGQKSATYGMYAVRPDGTGLRLVAPATGGIYFPDVSNDGSRIVQVTGGPDSTKLLVIDAQGAAQGNIPTSQPCPTVPAWSPDRSRLVYSLCGGGPAYTINANGSNEAVVNNGRAPSNVSWTPDGLQLVYGTSLGLLSHLAISNVDGSNEVLLTNLASEQVFDPAVSPDGSKIVFSRAIQHPGAATTADLFIVNSNGSDEQPLFSAPSYKSHPRWSPDGQSVVFVEDVSSSLKIIKLGDANPRPLVGGFASPPAWPSWTR